MLGRLPRVAPPQPFALPGRLTPSWVRGGTLGALALITFGTILLRLPSFFEPPWNTDEGTFAAVAQRVLAGVDASIGPIVTHGTVERHVQDYRDSGVEMPRTALASLGVPVSPENAADTVRAEMLVAADGHPLAVRLSSTN